MAVTCGGICDLFPLCLPSRTSGSSLAVPGQVDVRERGARAAGQQGQRHGHAGGLRP